MTSTVIPPPPAGPATPYGSPAITIHDVTPAEPVRTPLGVSPVLSFRGDHGYRLDLLVGSMGSAALDAALSEQPGHGHGSRPPHQPRPRRPWRRQQRRAVVSGELLLAAIDDTGGALHLRLELRSGRRMRFAMTDDAAAALRVCSRLSAAYHRSI